MRRHIIALVLVHIAALWCPLGAVGGDLNGLYHHWPRRSMAISMQQRQKWIQKGPRMRRLVIAGTDNSLGRITAPGVNERKLKAFSRQAVAGYQSSDGKFEIFTSPLMPGIVVTTGARTLDFFVGLKQKAEEADRPPQFLAWGSNGTIMTRRVQGALSIDNMDAPWLIAWRGGKVAYELPVLLVLQRPVRVVTVKKDRWTLSFDESAGTVVMLPLLGRQGVDTRNWKTALPKRAVARATAWSARLRRIPVAVDETYTINATDVRISETFQYLDIPDAWNTAPVTWSPLPPIFAMVHAMKGPVQLDQGARDADWLAAFGPLHVVEGRQQSTFTIAIPQLDEYLFAKPMPGKDPSADPRFVLLRDQLRGEVDKILAINRHMAPYQEHYTKEGWTNHLWSSPGETILTLIWALPYLEPEKAEALKNYIRREYEAYNPLKVSAVPIGVGAHREFFKPVNPTDGRGAARSTANAHNLYAIWAYMDQLAGRQEAAAAWPAVQAFMKRTIDRRIYLWDGGEQPSLNINPQLNAYIAYARLARLNGDEQAEQLAKCMLARGLAVKFALAHYEQFLIDRRLGAGLPPQFPPGFFSGDPDYRAWQLANLESDGLGFCKHPRWKTRWHYRFFADLTPEVGRFLHDYAQTPVRANIAATQWRFPGYWLNRGSFVYRRHETQIVQPWVGWAGFLAQAWALQQSPQQLWPYIGQSTARFGDLYYMQKLTAALSSFQ